MQPWLYLAIQDGFTFYAQNLSLGFTLTTREYTNLTPYHKNWGVLPSFYHDSQDLVFGGLSLQGMENFISPSETVQNTYG